MEQITLNVEDSHVKYAVELFFENYKDQVKVFLDNVLRGETGSSDSEIIKGEDGTITIYRTSPDKGWVLAEVLAGEYSAPLAPQKYTELPAGIKYVLFDGDKLALFLKEPEGEPDLKIGKFANLNLAFEDLSSEDVKSATEVAISRRDAGKKVDEDIERKAKLKALAKNETVS